MNDTATMTDREGVLFTKFGEVRFNATSGEHVALSTSPTYENGPKYIKVHGVSYYFVLHLHKKEDGSWDTADGDYIYLTRPDWKEPSWAAKRNSTAALKEAWTAFTKEHPEVLHEAERHYARERVSRAREEFAEVERELEAKREELRSAEEALAAL